MTDIQFETQYGLKSAKKAARNEIDGFLDPVYFKEEVLKKYEGDRNYKIGDDGTVQFGGEWGTFRGFYRDAGIICGTLGDLGECFPDEELKHWKLYNVHPDEVGITEYYTDFRHTLNRIVHFMDMLNKKMKNQIKLYYPEAIKFNCDSFDDNIFDLTHSENHLRFLKKVINESTSAEELEMKIVTLNCLVIDSINTKLLSKLLDCLDGNLKYSSSALTLISVKPDRLNDEEVKHYDSFIRPLRSLELLKRFFLVDDLHNHYYEQEKVITVKHFGKSRDEFHEFIKMEFHDFYMWSINKQDFENQKYFEHKISDITEKTSNLKLLNKFRNATAAHGHSPKNIAKMNRKLGFERSNDDYSALFIKLLSQVCWDIEHIYFERNSPILIKEYYDNWFNDTLDKLKNENESEFYFDELLSLIEDIPELFDEFEQQLIEVADNKKSDDDFIRHFGTFIGKISSQIEDRAQIYIDYLILKYKIEPILMWSDCYNIIYNSNELNDNFVEKMYPLLKDSIISTNPNEVYFSQSLLTLLIKKDISKINIEEIKHILADKEIYFDELRLS